MSKRHVTCAVLGRQLRWTTLALSVLVALTSRVPVKPSGRLPSAFLSPQGRIYMSAVAIRHRDTERESARERQELVASATFKSGLWVPGFRVLGSPVPVVVTICNASRKDGSIASYSGVVLPIARGIEGGRYSTPKTGARHPTWE